MLFLLLANLPIAIFFADIPDVGDTKIGSTGGILGGGLLLILGGAGQFLLSWLAEYIKGRREKDEKDHDTRRREKKEDEEDTIKRYQALLDRSEARQEEQHQIILNQAKENHEMRDRFNERILKLELKSARQALHIQYVESLLTGKKIGFKQWEDDEEGEPQHPPTKEKT